MHAVLISLGVMACVFGAGMAGLYGQSLLPPSHLSRETQDAVRLGIGMLSVLSSLVLGLLIASAKGSWDGTDQALRAYAGDLILLDETLRDYGDAAAPSRALLRDYTLHVMRDIWPPGGNRAPILVDDVTGLMLEHVRESIRALTPADAPAQWLQTQALQTQISLVRQRWQLIERQGLAVRPLVLAILVSWIAVIFASFSLNAPRNATVVAAFLVCSMAIGGSIFLILEMDTPFSGALAISSEPLGRAVEHMQEPR